MGRMYGRWASLGRGNHGGPESVGNKLGLGSDGGLEFSFVQMSKLVAILKNDHKLLLHQDQQKKKSKIRPEVLINRNLY